MGYRLHVRTVNKVEYGAGHLCADAEADFNRILSDQFGDDIFVSEDESSIEIPKGDFLDGMKAVGEIPEDEFGKEYPGLVKAGYGKKAFMDVLQDFWDTADPDNDEITFDWF